MSATLYEYRRYTAMPGKMPALLKRFEEHTFKYFARHGLRVVAFWESAIGENNQIHYVLEWDDLAEWQRRWDAFRADPDWAAARVATEPDGPLVEVAHNEFWRLARFSPPLPGAR